MMRRLPYLVSLTTILAATLLFNAVAHTPPVVVSQPLKTLPLTLGEWQGQMEFFLPGILATLKADDYLLRRYQPRAGSSIWLYVGYWGSQYLGTRVHSPAVCLPGAGWTIVESDTTPIAFQDRTIRVNRNIVQKDDETQLVLYWYQIRGKVVAREIPAMTWLAWTALTERRSDEALVRVTTPVVGTLRDALQAEVAFVRMAFPPLSHLLPQ